MSRDKKVQPAVAGATVDAESGADGVDQATDAAKALAALKVMRRRGLISDDDFQRRRASLEQDNH